MAKQQLSSLDTVAKSGYPFQMAVQHVIGGLSGCGWKVLCSEHGWSEPPDSGFIDVVAEKVFENGTAHVAVIECKKSVRKWVFIADLDQSPQFRASAYRSSYDGNKREMYRSDEDVRPASPEALYCVYCTESDRLKTLEQIAGDLVQSTRAFFRSDISTATTAGDVVTVCISA